MPQQPSVTSLRPLAGVKVVEFAGLAPGPMAGMILADFGADVVRVDRPVASAVPAPDVLARGKRSIAIDPKTPSGYAVVRKLVEQADVLIDPFRPGVMERLKLEPEVFLGDEKKGVQGSNKRLIYARLVGFPREGSHKDMAGHDLNYLALSGVLSMLPGEGKPTFPLNILADFAGGGAMCAMGILLALVERNRSGLGQVVNTDMVSGARYLSSFPLLLSQLHSPTFGDPRGTGLLDGGAPFYDVYTCADGRWMTVGCLEPQFFRVFVQRFVGALPKDFALDDGWRLSIEHQADTDAWSRMKEFMTRGFKSQPRDYWVNVFQGTDACTVPVLSVEEAAALAWATTRGGPVPNPHPRLERTPSVISSRLQSSDLSQTTVVVRGAHTEEILSQLGVGADEQAKLRQEGAFGGKSTAKL
ncbi:CoA-transferase family III [Lentinus tigrinus ALCF2SS1-7]|uniref:CoA-transferase family III n=1 Tax=Lentinus tigrinus ALCF2SS1-6 TaxID=1328759 RepID=A0A5C2SBF8_9APHY|nr:CoA-transferase family III [Lentinus tigrinus ALCF2SS1-6]RPD75164.1 CoA-transferase family III [Lentinus tigrinus ALCF2SS1-7]